MSRPKGSRNKAKDYEVKSFEESVETSRIQKIADETIDAPIVHTHTITSTGVQTVDRGTDRRKEIRYDGIFGIRFLRKDSLFPGLWELVKLDEKMNRVKVITDANAKGQVQILLMREVKRLVAVV